VSFELFTAAECQKKWKILRDKYTIEMRLNQEAKKSGSSAKKRKAWHLKEKLDFLKQYMENKK
jgi:hypothetical protein